MFYGGWWAFLPFYIPVIETLTLRFKPTLPYGSVIRGLGLSKSHFCGAEALHEALPQGGDRGRPQGQRRTKRFASFFCSESSLPRFFTLVAALQFFHILRTSLVAFSHKCQYRQISFYYPLLILPPPFLKETKGLWQP